MTDLTILIIRHADKPAGDVGGVDINGAGDPNSLTPQGWQRAGIWAELFKPSLGGASALPAPQTIFASAPSRAKGATHQDAGSKSERPEETVVPVAGKLGLEINLGFVKGQEADLAAALAQLDGGVVLVAWQHENIIDITNALAPGTPGVPAGWPDTRFNVVFRFDRATGASTWSFSQIVPIMLSGDLATPI